MAISAVQPLPSRFNLEAMLEMACPSFMLQRSCTRSRLDVPVSFRFRSVLRLGLRDVDWLDMDLGFASAQDWIRFRVLRVCSRDWAWTDILREAPRFG